LLKMILMSSSDIGGLALPPPLPEESEVSEALEEEVSEAEFELDEELEELVVADANEGMDGLVDTFTLGFDRGLELVW